jgi:hypothetical protein
MNVPKTLIIVGAIFLLAGLALLYFPKLPGLERLGKLPGDIQYEGRNVKVYFPWVTCLAISAFVTLLLKLFQWIKK